MTGKQVESFFRKASLINHSRAFVEYYEVSRRRRKKFEKHGRKAAPRNNLPLCVEDSKIITSAKARSTSTRFKNNFTDINFQYFYQEKFFFLQNI